MGKPIIWVTGPVASGKSTFIGAFSRAMDYRAVSLGKLLRARYGDDFFTNNANPGAPRELNAEVFQILTEEYHTFAPDYNGFIIDGCPRNAEQVSWISRFPRSMVLWVNPPRAGQVVDWVNQRPDQDLINARIRTQDEDLTEVHREIIQEGHPIRYVCMDDQPRTQMSLGGF